MGLAIIHVCSLSVRTTSRIAISHLIFLKCPYNFFSRPSPFLPHPLPGREETVGEKKQKKYYDRIVSYTADFMYANFSHGLLPSFLAAV